jgi:hypothetical protein
MIISLSSHLLLIVTIGRGANCSLNRKSTEPLLASIDFLSRWHPPPPAAVKAHNADDYRLAYNKRARDVRVSLPYVFESKSATDRRTQHNHLAHISISTFTLCSFDLFNKRRNGRWR